MAHDELSRSEIEELRRAFQDTALNNFPNPNRVGCPQNNVLQAIAETSLPLANPAWKHVSRCSPCFREIQEFKAELKRFRKRRRDLALRGALIATLGAAFASLAWRNHILSADLNASRKQSTMYRPQDSSEGQQRNKRNGETPNQYTTNITRTDEVPEAAISFLLWPGNERSSQSNQEQLILPSKQSRVLLLLQFDHGSYKKYEVVVKQVDGDREIIKVAGLTQHHLRRIGRTVSLVLNSKVFANSTYVAELRGSDSDGHQKTVEQYTFTVSHHG